MSKFTYGIRVRGGVPFCRERRFSSDLRGILLMERGGESISSRDDERVGVLMSFAQSSYRHAGGFPSKVRLLAEKPLDLGDRPCS